MLSYEIFNLAVVYFFLLVFYLRHVKVLICCQFFKTTLLKNMFTKKRTFLLLNESNMQNTFCELIKIL